MGEAGFAKMWAVDAEKKMIYGIAMKKVRMRDSRVKEAGMWDHDSPSRPGSLCI